MGAKTVEELLDWNTDEEKKHNPLYDCAMFVGLLMLAVGEPNLLRKKITPVELDFVLRKYNK